MLSQSLPASNQKEDPTSEGSGLRHLVDAIVSLALAVILFRSFFVEGYMISTGSMAPTLLGYHKQIVCPTCHHEFAFGVEFDDSVENASADDGSPTRTQEPETITCPHCGQTSIDVSDVPVTQGDQLLVDKVAWIATAPHRWDVVVFRNPQNPTQAYVKRIGGLPGESIQLRLGDLYINGELQRKPIEKQRAMRILVYDHHLDPHHDLEWKERWIHQDIPEGWKFHDSYFEIEQSAASAASSRETLSDSGTVDSTENQHTARTIQWLTYRHWVRSGGYHETVLQFEKDPGFSRIRNMPIINEPIRKQKFSADLLDKPENQFGPHSRLDSKQFSSNEERIPDSTYLGRNKDENGNEKEKRNSHEEVNSTQDNSFDRNPFKVAEKDDESNLWFPHNEYCPVSFDASTNQLICKGVLSSKWKDRLLYWIDDPAYQHRIEDFQARTHLAPIWDQYGYNDWLGTDTPHPVRDLMMTASYRYLGGEGSLLLEMSDGEQILTCEFHYQQQVIRIFSSNRESPLQEVPLPLKLRTRMKNDESIPLEMSLFDRQLLVTANGKLLFEPVLLPILSKPELEESPQRNYPRRPMRIGVRDLNVQIHHLQVYRDVYYTRGRAMNGVDEPFQLGEDEYFMLGDNSPVSSDSRSWNQGAVPERLILGKPFVVHLPSKPGQLEIGSWKTHIRIPDFSKIRYIR